MKSTHPITKAQARAPESECTEALAETMELLANRDFMDIVSQYRAGTFEMKPFPAFRRETKTGL